VQKGSRPLGTRRRRKGFAKERKGKRGLDFPTNIGQQIPERGGIRVESSRRKGTAFRSVRNAFENFLMEEGTFCTSRGNPCRKGNFLASAQGALLLLGG